MTHLNLALALAVTLHLLAAVIWVGGMFFAHMVLRPSAASLLEPPQRLSLWAGVFGRFFPWVWLCVALLLGSGLWLLLGPFLGGMAHARPYVHAMFGLGLLMMLLFAYVYFIPYPGLRRAVAAQTWAEAGSHLARIRLIVTVNLVLGLVTSAVAVGGRYL